MSESSVEYEYTISIPSLSRSPYTTVAHSEKQAILRIVYRVFSKRYSKAKLNSVVTDIIQNDKYKVLGRNPINVFDYEKLKPENPKKASAIRPAAINAMGSPSKALGTRASSSFSLTPAISTRARVKPIPDEIPFTIASIKVKSFPVKGFF